MSLTEQIVYLIDCDGCGTRLEDGGESVMVDKLDTISHYGWEHRAGQDLCPDCIDERWSP